MEYLEASSLKDTLAGYTIEENPWGDLGSSFGLAPGEMATKCPEDMLYESGPINGV